MKWLIKFEADITLNFGREVHFAGGAWQEILPIWMCAETIQGVNELIKNGVSFSIQDASGEIYLSSAENFQQVLGCVYRTLMPWKVQ